MNTLQQNIQKEWENKPMTYDWNKTNQYTEGTKEWFEEIDKRFFNEVSSFFAQNKNEKQFSGLIPYEKIKGKNVLEIGCGSGAHSRLIVEAGANLTAIDLTEKAIELTRKRLGLYGCEAVVKQMDAEHMDFPDNTFDFIWSWGVIHHSSNTEKIISEIYRVLKPTGEVRVMVYNWNSLNCFVSLCRGLLTGRLFRNSVQETLNYYSDGLVARYFTRIEFNSLFDMYFSSVETRTLGQKNELVVIPSFGGRLSNFKYRLAGLIPDFLSESILSLIGGFLFLVARNKKY